MAARSMAVRWSGAAVTLVLAPVVSADVVDLTSAFTSGTLNGAVFSTDSAHAAGSGFVNSFVRIQRNSTESGYNTSVASQQFGRDEVGGAFTRDITLGEVGVVAVGGTSYYQFLLDINEPSGGVGPLLTLDDVQIYTSETAHTEYKMSLAELGTLRYSMDAGGDNQVELNYDLNPQLMGPGGGSGTGDMSLLVPVSFFGGAGPETYVYLFSQFGSNWHSGDGFEEWWTPTVIPLPPAFWCAAASLAGLAGFSVARRRSLQRSLC